MDARVETKVKKTELVIRDTDIVPDEDQTTLISYRYDDMRSRFGIGDIANRLIEQNAQTDWRVPAKRIEQAVGRFCGKSARTVRYYREQSAFYGEGVRDTYMVLPFSFFVFARQQGDAWVDVLEFAVEHPYFTLDELSYFYETTQDVQESESESYPEGDEPDTGGTSSGANQGISKNGNSEIPRPITMFDKISILSTIGELIDTLGRVLEGFPLPARSKQKLSDQVGALRVLLQELSEIELDVVE